MDNNKFYIRLQAKIDDNNKTISELNKQIKSLEKQISKLEIQVDTKKLKSATGEYNTLAKALKSVDKSLTTSLKGYTLENEKIKANGTTIKKYVSEKGKVLTVTTRLVNGQEMFSAAVTKNNLALAKNVTATSNATAQYTKQADVLKTLKLNMNDLTKISSKTTSTGDVIEQYTDNAGKFVTLNGKMVKGNLQWSGAVKEVNQAVDTNAKQANKWQYSWSKAFQSFTTYMSVTTIFYQIINTTKEMINEVTELDSALVELQKVTDLEGDSLKEFTKEAYDAAQAVAKTGTEMVQASTEFAKAGYDKNQILQLGQLALMYTNIADEEVSAAEASEFMIAQMKAFNIEAEDAIHIIDAVNEVANNYAVSSADIANNLGKSSAVMANAGNSYEQMIGLLTAGTEITRNASKVSNGLKTITLRLQGMDDEGEENLELVAQMEALYQKLGISVYNSNGEMKNTYELLETLAPIYQKATAAEKAYITETIAGKYQAQNAAAILNNFSVAIDATNTAMNSSGSAFKENEKVLDSIQGKVKQFQSAFEELSQSIISSDFIKGIVDLGTGLLRLANTNFAQSIMGMAASFTVLKAGFGIFDRIKDAVKSSTLLYGLNTVALTKNALASSKLTADKRKEIVQLLLSKGALDKTNGALTKETTAKLKNILATTNMTKKEKADVVAKLSASAANKSLTLSTFTLKGAVDALTASIAANPIGAILVAATAVVSIISFIGNSIKEANEKAHQAMIDEADSARESYENTKNKVVELEGKLADVREQVDNLRSKGALTFVEQEQLNKLENTTLELEKQYKYEKMMEDIRAKESNKKQLKVIEDDLFKGDVTRFRNNGNEFFNAVAGSGIPLISDVSANFTTEAYKITESDVIDETIEDYKDAISSLEDYSKQVIDLKGKIEEANKKGADTTQLKDDLESAEYWEKFYKGYSADKQSELVKYSERLKKYADSLVYVEDATDEADIRSNQFKAALNSQYEQILKLIEKEKYVKNTMDSIVSHEQDTEGIQYLKGLAEAGNYTAKNVEEARKKFKDFDDVIKNTKLTNQDVADYLNSLDATVEILGVTAASAQTVKENLDELQEAYQTLYNAQEEYNENGYLTIDTMQSLLELDGKYLTYLVDENGQLNLNKDAFINLAQAQIDEARAAATVAYAKKLLVIQQVALGKATDDEKKKYADLINTYQNSQAIIDKTKAKIEQFKATISASGNSEAIGLMEAAEKEYKAEMAIYDKVSLGFGKNFNNSMGSGKKSSSSGSSSKSEKEWWETELDKLKDQFKYNEITIEEYIGGLDNLLGRVQKGTDAWRKINEELQKQRLTKVEDDYKRGTISLDEYINKLKELIQAYKQGSDAWNDLADKIKKALQDKAKKQKDDLSISEKAAINLINEEIDKLKKLKDEKEEYYDKLIEDKKKANEETEKELELARLQEALANAQKEKTKRVWREGIGWVWETDQQAIKDAQEALDDFKNEQYIDKLEKEKEEALKTFDDQISKIEEYKKSWEDVADSYEKQQERIVLAETLGAQIQNDILNQKIEAVKKYQEEYLKTMAEIEKYEKTSADKLSGYNTPSVAVNSGGASSAPSGSSSRSYTVQRGDTLSGIAAKYGVNWHSIYDANKGIIGGNPNLIRAGQTLTIPGFATGGEVDYTGLAMLHGTKSKPEYVLNNDQMRNMLSNLTRPQTSSNINTSSSAVNNYNFGNIELPNVTNAKQFVTELKSLVNITKHQ